MDRLLFRIFILSGVCRQRFNFRLPVLCLLPSGIWRGQSKRYLNSFPKKQERQKSLDRYRTQQGEEKKVLDRWTVQLLKKPQDWAAGRLKAVGCSPDQVTVCSFGIGLGALPALYLHMYLPALVLILLNRIGDGLDGALARKTEASDAGGFLDIVLDFIFYSSVVLGFALAHPETNGLAASVLLFTFVGTGSSFLAFAIMAERRGFENIVFPHKKIYYLGGLTEGTETFLFFVLFCIFPGHFAFLAYVFAAICLLTMVTRVIGGYLALR